MKVVMKPIEIIAWFTVEGKPRPIKFRMVDDSDSYITVKVDRIIDQKEEKLAGNRMILFVCESIIGNIERVYEIKYELNTCRWFLFKI